MFDVAVIGGGIAGACVFAEACRAGVKAVLLERGKAGGATTAVTSALYHGGLRYLPYDAATSLDMARETGRLLGEAPGLLRRQAFLWPVYDGHALGLRLVEALLDCYDSLSGLRHARKHARLTPAQAREALPALSGAGLRGALAFDEWAVDVPGLMARLLERAVAAGGVLLEGRRVSGLRLEGGRIAAALVQGPAGREEVPARVFVNAAGPWAAEVAAMAGARAARLTLRKGTHLVAPGEPPAFGLIFPDSSGRYVGLYPRAGEAWIGPTDDPHAGGPDDAAPTAEELARLAAAAAAVLPGLRGLRAGQAGAASARGVAGLRPIFAQRAAGALLSRDFRVVEHAREGVANLVSLLGGKLTTHRLMGRAATEAVLRALGLPGLAPEVEEPPPAGFPWRLLGDGGRIRTLALSSAALACCALRRVLGAAPARLGLEAFREEGR